MLALLADEHIPTALVQGLTARQPALDLVTVQEIGRRGSTDAELLEWAAGVDRVVVTFDRNTFTAAAKERMAAGQLMTGLIVVDDLMPNGQAIEEILIVAECCVVGELHGRIVYVPLR